MTDRKRVEEDRERFFSVSLDLICILGADAGLRRLSPAFEALLAQNGFRVEVVRPFHGLDREARRVWARARGRRAPAEFPVWIAEKGAR